MKNPLKRLFDFLLPPRCINCGSVLNQENGLCPECFNNTTFITEPYCSKCGLPFAVVSDSRGKKLCPACLKDKRPVLRLSRSAVKYDEFFKKSIIAFKFMDKTQNAKIFAKLLKTAGKDIFQEGVDVLIPVPLHYKRLIKRRYNQSALLAFELSKLINKPVLNGCLIKFKATKPQVSFSGRARHQNIKGVFKVKNPSLVANKRVVLIDDVMTTGATLQECAKVLCRAGAKSVDTLTVARVYD